MGAGHRSTSTPTRSWRLPRRSKAFRLFWSSGRDRSSRVSQGALPEASGARLPQPSHRARGPECRRRPSGEDAGAESDDPELAAADERLRRGDLEGAEPAYRSVLADATWRHRGESGPGERDLLKRTAGLDPSNRSSGRRTCRRGTHALLAADLELLDGQVDAAFERLVDSGTPARPATSVRPGEHHLLESAGPGRKRRPAVLAARRRLASALF